MRHQEEVFLRQYRAASVQARPRKKNRKLYIMVKLLIFLVSYLHRLAENAPAGKLTVRRP